MAENEDHGKHGDPGKYGKHQPDDLTHSIMIQNKMLNINISWNADNWLKFCKLMFGRVFWRWIWSRVV